MQLETFSTPEKGHFYMGILLLNISEGVIFSILSTHHIQIENLLSFLHHHWLQASISDRMLCLGLNPNMESLHLWIGYILGI